MYDKKWLMDVQDTKRNIPAAQVAIGQIKDIPTRNLLRDQLNTLEGRLNERLAGGYSVHDVANSVRELLILARDIG